MNHKKVFHGIVKGLSFKGLGVVQHPEGQIFFCHGVWPGDEGKFLITEQKKKFGFAKLLELTKHSQCRRNVPCPHMGFEKGKCGGCSWMIAEYPAQLEEKQKLVEYHVFKEKLVEERSKIKKIWASPNEFGYRNRAQLKSDGHKVGYISPESHVLAPIEDCIILNEHNRKLLKNICELLPQKKWIPTQYRYTLLDIDDSLNEPKVNQKGPFRQANSEQNQKMKTWLEEKIIEFHHNDPILELFAGSGNFTEVLQKKFQNVFATDLPLNIYLPESWDVVKEKMTFPKILLLDPPREGFSDIHHFLKLFPSIDTIFYISCDISTFVQDIKKVLIQGFEIQEIQPLDMFPQTHHIELLAQIKRPNEKIEFSK